MLIKKLKYTIFFLACILASVVLCSCGNPHAQDYLNDQMHESLNTLKRVDDAGKLYEMDIKFDYESKEFQELLAKNNLVKPNYGCTTFSTHNDSDDVVSCRNFDANHRVNGSNNEDGIFVIYHCHQEGLYKSISIGDIKYLNDDNEKFSPGALDDGKTDISNIVLSLFDPLDGINEKGLSVFSLDSDVKSNEEPYTALDPKHESCTVAAVMRHILDKCATVDEACEMVKQYNIIGYYDTTELNHLFVTDQSGKSKVIEWRHNEVRFADTDVSSNFYQTWNDAEPHKSVLDSRLINTYKNYTYGYGHGYDRFNTVVSTLQQNAEGYKTKMNQDTIRDLLSVVSQKPYKEKSSFTQYSTVYNNNKLSLDLWLSRDFSKKYSFSIS